MRFVNISSAKSLVQLFSSYSLVKWASDESAKLPTTILVHKIEVKLISFRPKSQKYIRQLKLGSKDALEWFYFIRVQSNSTDSLIVNFYFVCACGSSKRIHEFVWRLIVVMNITKRLSMHSISLFWKMSSYLRERALYHCADCRPFQDSLRAFRQFREVVAVRGPVQLNGISKRTIMTLRRARFRGGKFDVVRSAN